MSQYRPVPFILWNLYIIWKGQQQQQQQKPWNSNWFKQYLINTSWVWRWERFRKCKQCKSPNLFSNSWYFSKEDTHKRIANLNSRKSNCIMHPMAIVILSVFSLAEYDNGLKLKRLKRIPELYVWTWHLAIYHASIAWRDGVKEKWLMSQSL